MSEKHSHVPSKEAIYIGRELDRWRRKSSLTQVQMQDLAGVSQGQLSRVLNGKFSRMSPWVEDLCRSAGINLPQKKVLTKKEKLRRDLDHALRRCWDGSEAHALEIKRLLDVVRNRVR